MHFHRNPSATQLYAPKVNGDCSADVQKFANKALVQWTTNIADRINNPVAGIAAALDIIEKQFLAYQEKSTFDEDLMNKAISLTRARLDVLNKYLSDVVTVAQPTKISPRVVDPNSLINEAVEATLASSNWTGHISINIDPDVTWISCDPQKIVSMLVALLENSIEAVNPSENPDIAVSLHHAFDEAGKKNVVFSVCDNGHGIDLERLQLIKMPFYTTKEARAGFGFALIEKIAAAHGGKLAIHQCNELKGAQVSVIMPTGITNSVSATNATTGSKDV